MTPAAAKNILVVEDERIVARDIQRGLIDLGYEVPTTAASAEQAIQLASERRPDLVLMDIRIKGPTDGIQTAALIRERFDVPVVYLTAYADAVTLDRAKSTQPYGYLVKPVKPTELRSTVELALYKHERDRLLREREHWLSTTLRSIGDAIVLTDPDGCVSYMNPVAEALTGLPLADVVGRSSDKVIQLVDPRSRPLENPLRTALRERVTVEVSGSLRRGEHEERLIADSTAPIVDDRGRVLGAVMVFRDISEQRLLEQQAEVTDRLAAMAAMTAGIAHEVNNPLAIVLANLDFALEKLHHDAGSSGGGELELAIRDAQEAGDRIRRIVGDLTKFGRPNPATSDLVDVNEVLAWALTVAAPALLGGIEVKRDLGAVPLVRAAQGHLGQVFVNLLINAARACTAATAQILVTTGTDASGKVVIELRDTGCGIPPETLPRIFEPFFTAKPGGMGLGLSISRGIVKALGGDITVESEVGRGTSVRVVIPPAPPAEAAS